MSRVTTKGGTTDVNPASRSQTSHRKDSQHVSYLRSQAMTAQRTTLAR